MDDKVFATRRLTMRDFRETDLENVIRMWRDPKVARDMDEAPRTPTQTGTWLTEVIHHNRIRPREAYNLAITLTGMDRAVGWVGFGPSGRDHRGGTFGIGFLLDSAHWRRGYMSEVLTGAANFVFDQLNGSWISAWCYAENLASARTLESAGFKLTRQYPCNHRTIGTSLCREFEIAADHIDMRSDLGTAT